MGFFVCAELKSTFVSSTSSMKSKLFLVLISISLYGCQSSHSSADFGEFSRSLNSTPWGYQWVSDPIVSDNSMRVERFEVRAGDCGSQTSWNDCENDRERSELSQRTHRQKEGDTYWYAWEVYFPEDYPSVYPTKTALGQFHQVNGKPVFMFQNQTHSVKGQNKAESGGYHLDWHAKGKTKGFWPLINEKDLRGQWHRIEVQAKWTKQPDGYFNVWVDGERKVAFKGQTMEKEQVYFKYGVYRSYLSRYKEAHGEENLPTQVVYYRNVVRGESRDEVQK